MALSHSIAEAGIFTGLADGGSYRLIRGSPDAYVLRSLTE
jgi:hypothetical protein